MESSNKPIANPVAVLREEFDDWAVLFNPDTADAVGINPVGVAMWKLLDGQHGLDEIAVQAGRAVRECAGRGRAKCGRSLMTSPSAALSDTSCKDDGN